MKGPVMRLVHLWVGVTESATPIYAFSLKNVNWTHLFKEKA